MKKIRDLYEICPVGKVEPEYILEFEMDSNDADYIRDKTSFSAAGWDGMHDFFFLMLAYLARGYSGKFSHGESWGDYYGHHWEENGHGFAKMIDDFSEAYEMMCYNEYGPCHSFSDFDLYYRDENGVMHDVEIPNIDDMFETEEEMISAMKAAYKEWNCDNDDDDDDDDDETT